jgi:hypothetical protein
LDHIAILLVSVWSVDRGKGYAINITLHCSIIQNGQGEITF